MYLGKVRLWRWFPGLWIICVSITIMRCFSDKPHPIYVKQSDQKTKMNGNLVPPTQMNDLCGFIWNWSAKITNSTNKFFYIFICLNNQAADEHILLRNRLIFAIEFPRPPLSHCNKNETKQIFGCWPWSLCVLQWNC